MKWFWIFLLPAVLLGASAKIQKSTVMVKVNRPPGTYPIPKVSLPAGIQGVGLLIDKSTWAAGVTASLDIIITDTATGRTIGCYAAADSTQALDATGVLLPFSIRCLSTILPSFTKPEGSGSFTIAGGNLNVAVEAEIIQ